jgi:hypothetical protein
MTERVDTPRTRRFLTIPAFVRSVMQGQRLMMKTISCRAGNPDQMMQGVSFQEDATPF